MKILRLTNSSDLYPGIPPERRSPAVAERLIASATGESVETIQKAMWPTPEFPDVVQRWMEQHQPDVVFFRLSSFWVAYESVPLRVSRKLGRFGGPVANAGLRIGERPWLVERAAYKATRRAVVRVVRGDTYFTPTAATEILTEVFRKIATQESVIPVVRGTSLLLNSSGSKAGLSRSKSRVAELNHLTEAACNAARIPFFAEPPALALSTNRLGDEIHDDAAAHERLGIDDGEAIVKAWTAAMRPYDPSVLRFEVR